MESSSTLIKISGPALEAKKSELIKDSQNIFAYWKESEQDKAFAYKLGFWGVWEAAQPQQTKLLYK